MTVRGSGTAVAGEDSLRPKSWPSRTVNFLLRVLVFSYRQQSVTILDIQLIFDRMTRLGSNLVTR